MNNNNIPIISNGQSAGVNAPQRINAKELWYILGIIEADGSFSCYKEKTHIRAEMSIGLEENDIKLLYWIKSELGYGQVKVVTGAGGESHHPPRKHSNKEKYPKNKVARYIIRSKVFIEKNFLKWYDLYPPLTVNKTMRIKYVKDCLSSNEIQLKNFEINSYSDRGGVRFPHPSPRTFPQNMNLYIKDWIIGFIEGDGSFYFVQRGDKRIAEFNIGQIGEVELLNIIGREMGLSLLNKVSVDRGGVRFTHPSPKANQDCVLTAVSLIDIQAVINFMFNSDRVRLKGLKKVKFLLWITELRTSPRYSGLKIPFEY